MNGILLINKPKDYTSHDIVAIVKKITGEKVGHTGTLDPNATGVLPLLIGKATGISKYLINHDKIYIATLKLGEKRDTADSEGKVIETKKVECITEEKVKRELSSIIGKQEQTPPIYSAIKIKGKKLYEYARSGKEIEIPKRSIEIYNTELIKIEEDEITFKVSCSKGTYIRSLCEKIAEDLNTVGYMKELQRVQVGEFNIGQAVGIVEIRKNPTLIEEKIISIEKYFEKKRKNKIITKRIKNVFEWYANKKRL